MSYFSIKDFIEDGRKTLKEKHYWSALSVALILPSMCSRIEFKDKEEYKNNGRWRDRKCYEDFCKVLFENDLYIKETLGDEYYKILYSLRCDIAHAGVANVYNGEKRIFFTNNSIGVCLSQCWIIPIEEVCESVFDECETWLKNNGIRECKETRYFDTEHENDDRLLLERLCENDRKDFLEEEFNKEIEEADGHED